MGNKFEFFRPLMFHEEYKFIEKFLTKDDIFLEWGSGNSTIYYSDLVKKVISIEHDIDYYNQIKNTINIYSVPNIEQIYIPSHYPDPNPSRYEQFKDYIECPSNSKLKFTKVLIDGRARIYCAFSILDMIDENTIVFIHDFNRAEYQPVLQYYDIVERVTSNNGIVALKKKSQVFSKNNKENEGVKTYNVLSFFNEFDLLELRIKELYDVVDYFIITEGTLTHSGKPKSINFEINKNRLLPFEHKIIFHQTDEFPITTNNWVRENYQRDVAYDVLKDIGAKDDDIIIITDADEIPSKNSILEYQNMNNNETRSLNQTHYYYFMNNEKDGVWSLPKITRMCRLKEKTLTNIRIDESDGFIGNGGWHFSYLGGITAIKEKIEAFAHQEINKDIKNIDLTSKDRDLFGRKAKFTIKKIDKTFPEYINEPYLQKYILPINKDDYYG